MKNLLILINILLLAVMLTACGCSTQQIASAPIWQEQYDLGMRYLSEGNYQEAIIAFKAAIEIEPQYAESYLKAAEAYEAMGDLDSARSILEKGYATTGNAEIQQYLDQLTRQQGDMTSPTENELKVEDIVGQSTVVPFQFTVGNKPFYHVNLYDAFAEYGFLVAETYGMGWDYVEKQLEEYAAELEQNDGTFPYSNGTLMFTQYADFAHLTSLYYNYGDRRGDPNPEFCDIQKEDSVEIIFKKLGLQLSPQEIMNACMPEIPVSSDDTYQNENGDTVWENIITKSNDDYVIVIWIKRIYRDEQLMTEYCQNLQVLWKNISCCACHPEFRCVLSVDFEDNLCTNIRVNLTDPSSRDPNDTLYSSLYE